MNTVIIRAHSGNDNVADILVSFDTEKAKAQHEEMMEAFDWEKYPFAVIEVLADFDVTAHLDDNGELLCPQDDDALNIGHPVPAGPYLDPVTPPCAPFNNKYQSIVISKAGYKVLVREGYGGQGYTTPTL